MSCNIDLYLDFDPHTMKTDPTADIATLVEVALASEESIDAAEMHKSTEWPLRCFNPAFAFLVSRIDDGRVCQSRRSDVYPAGGFFLTDQERVDLRRLAARLRGK